MTNRFRESIRAAENNATLKVALFRNSERRTNARAEAYSSLPDAFSVLRAKANAIRKDVIENLDIYLDEFVQQLETNGITVHHASDADSARAIILKIAETNGVKRVIKSKSMVSEEIKINDFLQNAGIEVVETDLGEFIIQLRGEKPAHIITPAVHLLREDVGKTFHEKLGVPYTNDVEIMTRTARKVLRKIFLQADMGISGVNFGVVDDGALCILTNEGNGRMVTTLPKIHVAVMGMERLVPSLDDLATMLYLLPRSATGQKITVYVNLIRSTSKLVKTSEIADFPDDESLLPARHLILIDNGREHVRSSTLRESLYCIRCGACLNACPVFREIGGHSYVSRAGEGSVYPGPIGSIISPALFGQEAYGHLARASSLCGACADACPVEIELPKLLLRVRAGLTNEKGIEPSMEDVKPNTPKILAMGLKVFTWMALSQSRFAFAQRLFGRIDKYFLPKNSWLRLPAFTGWGVSKDFPHLPAQSFHQIWTNGQVNHYLSSSSKNDLIQYGPKDENLANKFETKLQKFTDEELVKRFSEELTELDGEFIQCNRKNLAKKIKHYLVQQGIKRVQVGKSEDFPEDVENLLKSAGIEIEYGIDPAIRVGISTALAGIAETGTLVMANSDRNITSASLVPLIHLAILDSEFIVPDWRHIFEWLKSANRKSVVFISGPSRTADIEMTLTIGVHGPQKVCVFCITPFETP